MITLMTLNLTRPVLNKNDALRYVRNMGHNRDGKVKRFTIYDDTTCGIYIICESVYNSGNVYYYIYGIDVMNGKLYVMTGDDALYKMKSKMKEVLNVYNSRQREAGRNSPRRNGCIVQTRGKPSRRCWSLYCCSKPGRKHCAGVLRHKHIRDRVRTVREDGGNDSPPPGRFLHQGRWKPPGVHVVWLTSDTDS